MEEQIKGLAIRSLITSGGELRLSLEEEVLDAPGPDDVVVRVEAAPINPSDLGLLLGPADITTLASGGGADRPTLSAAVSPRSMAALRPRIDQAMPVGNEGAGTVVRAGANASALLGRTVGMRGGGMYAQFRRLAARDCTVLPEGASAEDGASMFVNPLTSLGFVETMRAEGHTAIVHTAAASNLGQMLTRICLKDAIPLVNIVRSEAQVQILREIGAEHVIDSTAADFEARLVDAVAATGATIAFDAIGGGRQASRILSAMETVASGRMNEFSRYGSDAFKQVYIYGVLDPSPTVLDRWVGFAWSVRGWLLTQFLRQCGRETLARLQRRVADELTTTFASRYTDRIGLADMLRPEILEKYNRKATGEKYLVVPGGG